MNTIAEKIIQERASFDALGNIYPPQESIAISKTAIAGVNCYWLTPPSTEYTKILLYLHGGAFTMGNIHSHKALVSHIAHAINTPVVFIEYPLAPEHPFPAPANAILDVYQAIQQSYPDSKFTIMGDSAGGTLAVSAVHQMIAKGISLPDSIILLSPWLNLKCNTNSYKTRQELDPVLTKQILSESAGAYLKNTSSDADPNELIFTAFPPTFILVGSREILFDDAKNFYDYLAAIETDVTMKEYPDQTHVWPLTNIHSESARAALQDIQKFMTGAPEEIQKVA